MTVSYATVEHLYRHGLPRGSLVERGRLVSSADPAANRLEVEGHSLAENTAVMFTVDAGGELPAGLSPLTIYYAKRVALGAGLYSESLFQVSAAEGGAAVDLTDEGTNPFRLCLSGVPTAETQIEVSSQFVHKFATAHVVPFTEPYPVEVVNLVARHAALELRHNKGLTTDADYDMLLRSWTRDAERHFSGTPFRDSTATAPANLARYGTASATDRPETLP